MSGAAFSLWKREWVRFFRQRSRVVGAIVPPVLFWFLMGSGFGSAFRFGDADYLRYFFPGSVMLIVLFTAIFSTISLIEDRTEGFLQSVLVAPEARPALVIGKIGGGTTIAVAQGLIFLLAAPALGYRPGATAALSALAALVLSAFGLSALGFWLAWRLNSVQGFHAIMNIVLMPMWLLSGALFPGQEAPLWLSAVMHVNPLSWGLDAFRQSLSGGPLPWIHLGALSLLAAFLTVTCLRVVRRA